MPTYAYACTACDNRFEVHQSFTDDALTECPECAGRIRKLFNSVGIVFKGSGFYRTDSRGGSTSTSPASEGSSSSGAAKDSGSSSKDSGSSSTTTKDAGSSSSVRRERVRLHDQHQGALDVRLVRRLVRRLRLTPPPSTGPAPSTPRRVGVDRPAADG